MNKKIILLVAVLAILAFYLINFDPLPKDVDATFPRVDEVSVDEYEIEPPEVLMEGTQHADKQGSFLRYKAEHDPLHSPEAKKAYYDWIAEHLIYENGPNFILSILDMFAGNDDDVRKAISLSEKFEIYAAVPYLRKIIDQSDHNYVRLAVSALITFDDAAGYEYVLGQLEGQDALRWQNGLRAIVNRGKTEYIDDLYSQPSHRGAVG